MASRSLLATGSILDAHNHKAHGQTGAISAIIAISAEIRDITFQGLRTTTNDREWFDYWDRDRLVKFERLNKALWSLLDAVYSTDDQFQKLIEHSNQVCRSVILRTLPDLASDLDEAERNIQTACEIVMHFKALQVPKLRAVDTECAARFSGAISWFGIVMNSITVACEHYQNPILSIIEFLRTMAGVTSKLALHAAQAAANLRRVPPEDHLILNAVVKPADDGIGFVASLPELNLETCAETEAEMQALLKSTVAGYFDAEKKRGGLQRALSELHIEGVPRNLVVSLYVLSNGDMTLTEVMNLEF